MSNSDKGTPKKMSRREFVKDTGLVVGGIALGSIAASSIGCQAIKSIFPHQTQPTEITPLVSKPYTLSCKAFSLDFGSNAELKKCTFHNNKSDTDITVFPGDRQVPITATTFHPETHPQGEQFYFSSNFLEAPSRNREFISEPSVFPEIIEEKNTTYTKLTFKYPNDPDPSVPINRSSQMKVTAHEDFLEFELLGASEGCENIHMLLVRFLNINYFCHKNPFIREVTGDQPLTDYSFNATAYASGIDNLKDLGQGLMAGIIYGSCETVPLRPPDPSYVYQQNLWRFIYPPGFSFEGSNIGVLGASSADWLPAGYKYEEKKRNNNRFAFFICKEKNLRVTISTIETYFEKYSPEQFTDGSAIWANPRNNLDYWLVHGETNVGAKTSTWGDRIAAKAKDFGIKSILLERSFWQYVYNEDLYLNDTTTFYERHNLYAVYAGIADDVMPTLLKNNLSVGLHTFAYLVSQDIFTALKDPGLASQVSKICAEGQRVFLIQYADKAKSVFVSDSASIAPGTYSLSPDFVLTIPEIMADAFAATSKELKANWFYFDAGCYWVGWSKHEEYKIPSQGLNFYLISRIMAQIVRRMKENSPDIIMQCPDFYGSTYPLISRSGTGDYNYLKSPSESTTDVIWRQRQSKRLLQTPDLGWFGSNLLFNNHPFPEKLDWFEFCRASALFDVPMGLEFMVTELEQETMSGYITSAPLLDGKTVLVPIHANYKTSWLKPLVWNTVRRRNTRSAIEFKGISGIPVAGLYGVGVLKLDKDRLLATHLTTENNNDDIELNKDPHNAQVWQINSLRDHIGPVGDFDGDKNDELLLLSPTSAMVGQPQSGDSEFTPMTSTYWQQVADTGTDSDKFQPVDKTIDYWKGAFGIAKPEPIVSGALTKIINIQSLQASTVAHDGDSLGGWVFNSNKDIIGPVGNFEGPPNLQDEFVMVNDSGIAIMKLSGQTFTTIIKSKNGDGLGQWSLNTLDNHFLFAGNFDKSGKAGIFVTSPWGIGIIKLSSDNKALVHSVMQANGSKIGNWTLDTETDRFLIAADFDGYGEDEILITNTRTGKIGIMHWVYTTLPSAYVNEFQVTSITQSVSMVSVTFDFANAEVGPIGFYDGSSKAGILMSSPTGIAVLRLDSGNTVFTPLTIVLNGNGISSSIPRTTWILDTKLDQFGPSGNYDGTSQRKDSIFVKNPQRIGIIRMNSSNTNLEVECIADNQSSIGSWYLETADNKFGFAT